MEGILLRTEITRYRGFRIPCVILRNPKIEIHLHPIIIGTVALIITRSRFDDTQIRDISMIPVQRHRVKQRVPRALRLGLKVQRINRFQRSQRTVRSRPHNGIRRVHNPLGLFARTGRDKYYDGDHRNCSNDYL